uniref:NB-ARC domain-containing protein n=1 Tax=Solanum lycopersicum TaxID=4081 RepID=K4DEN7_SOLLC
MEGKSSELQFQLNAFRVHIFGLQITEAFPQTLEVTDNDKSSRILWLESHPFDISRWDASEESFPLLKTLVISWCDNLEEIPLGFADIPTLKQIKLICVGGEIHGRCESSMCLVAVTIAIADRWDHAAILIHK